MKFPLLNKAGALLGVTLGLMWALSSVQSVVHERQSRQLEAERNVANSLATSQTLMGPVLSRRCTETWLSGHASDGKPVMDSKTSFIRLPATQINVSGKVEMTPRYRGMFKVNGYAAKPAVTAHWGSVAALTPPPEFEGGRVECEAPVLGMALTDARGIRVADLTVLGRNLPVRPGSGLEAQPNGFQATLPDGLWASDTPLDLVLKLELAGTQTLSIAPVANTTLVTLDSDWPHPSFGGRFLPSERQVLDHGFSATWKVTSLASTAQQEWLRGASLCQVMSDAEPVGDGKANCIESFGVAFVDPVNAYVLGDRATKYGLLFIVLTFVGVGLVEVLRRLRVHPVQYLLVGAALSVFFLLLVSLSEHMAFAHAYTAASLACTLLLGFYGSFVLQGWRAGTAFGAGIAALFGTLYALLQLEQTALVLGAVMLFLVLAVIMVSTRKLDWYELMAEMRGQAA
ncbi:MAG: cell envelope integrity protein CreD [Rubrivivax sp.]|nr:MAG: cell envelope integrity protein CreD [Rubrivivax sp.]